MEEKRKNRILVVEDDPDTRFALSLLFEMEGFDIDLACDGEEAYSKAMEEQPDLIVTDINMPGVSGLDLIDHIKNDERLKHIPIVAMSAVERKQLKRAQELGAIAVYQKPVEYDKLFKFIASVMSSRRNRTRKQSRKPTPDLYTQPQ
ncbi:MAG TPA: response regulator [Blastocatellia bacterium]|nr:response regulator [Blastocatellia bacterium]